MSNDITPKIEVSLSTKVVKSGGMVDGFFISPEDDGYYMFVAKADHYFDVETLVEISRLLNELNTTDKDNE